MRRLSAFVLGVVPFWISFSALAETCNRADLLTATPPDEATMVPTNAFFTARYRSTAEYIDEVVRFGHDDGDMVDVLPSFESATGTLSVVPPETLQPDTSYVIEWPGLRGLGSASRGQGVTVHFRTGSGPDQTAPWFPGATGIEWAPTRELDDCTDRHEDRFEFTLSLAPVTDDFGTNLLDLVVFQTKGPLMGESEGPRQVHIQRYDGDTVTFTRPLEDAEGDVCFAALARDATGQVSASGSREVCATTKLPPVFQGCALGRADGTSAGRNVAFAALLTAAFAWLVRSRRHFARSE